MHKPRIIITRPEPEASRWASSLAALGVEAIALPLIEITPLTNTGLDAARRDATVFDALMFVSPAAVNAFFSQPVASSGEQRFLATGPGTVRALRNHGVAESAIDAPPPDAPQFDSESLWQVVRTRTWQGKRVLIVRGQSAASAAPPEAANGQAPAKRHQGSGRDWLTRQLQAAGAMVELVAAYQRGLPRWPGAQQASAAQAASDGSIWVFSSSEAVLHLAQLMPQGAWHKVPCICTHERIAQATQALGFARIQICKPSLDALAALCHAQ
ncbi:MAG: hypothetical protein RLZZ271_833 [Pseudomonadota bacterium]|jgi:uroporphyrinogen-III synthase